MTSGITEKTLNWMGPLLMKDRPKLKTGNDADGFYMFLWANEPRPLYIGQAWYESIRSRITSHRGFSDRIGRYASENQVSIEKVEFKIAYFHDIDKSLFKDIENLLVFYSQPILPGHENWKTAYHGRNLKIHNTGAHEPLKPEMPP
jgi:hypothetical protein